MCNVISVVYGWMMHACIPQQSSFSSLWYHQSNVSAVFLVLSCHRYARTGSSSTGFPLWLISVLNPKADSHFPPVDKWLCQLYLDCVTLSVLVIKHRWCRQTLYGYGTFSNKAWHRVDAPVTGEDDMIDFPRRLQVKWRERLATRIGNVESQAAQSRCTVVRPIQKSIGKWEIRPPVKS